VGEVAGVVIFDHGGSEDGRGEMAGIGLMDGWPSV
jgi:hypothetical protein